MICIVDYGVGNLFSLNSAFSILGLETVVSGRAADLRRADKIVLPGVGAFEDAARKLRESGLAGEVVSQARAGKPLLGICLGMQLLFDESHEYGVYPGLGLIPGRVLPLSEPLKETSLKIPHIGWNAMEIKQTDPVFRYVEHCEHVYFVHSFYASDCAASTLATAEYGIDVTAVVRRGSVYGMQFHPEKSGKAGLGLLRAFSEL